MSRKAASVHQKHPPAKVAMPFTLSCLFIFFSFLETVGEILISCGGLAQRLPQSKAKVAKAIRVARRAGRRGAVMGISGVHKLQAGSPNWVLSGLPGLHFRAALGTPGYTEKRGN